MHTHVGHPVSRATWERRVPSGCCAAVRLTHNHQRLYLSQASTELCLWRALFIPFSGFLCSIIKGSKASHTTGTSPCRRGHAGGVGAMAPGALLPSLPFFRRAFLFTCQGSEKVEIIGFLFTCLPCLPAGLRPCKAGCPSKVRAPDCTSHVPEHGPGAATPAGRAPPSGCRPARTQGGCVQAGE